ncbi:MAG: FtsW/RodA/SpoVE family cell cycle protein [Oscillospiraceae bacterium]|jgi:cell division protein FtsW|nr:FtsW/RodA/SpoVE family cell cycle protein [Oscillospiraceae bacterium]
MTEYTAYKNNRDSAEEQFQRSLAENPNYRKSDVPFFLLSLILLIIGLAALLSASFVDKNRITFDVIIKQLVAAPLVVVAMYLASFIPVSRLDKKLTFRNLSLIFWAVAVVLTFLTLRGPFSVASNGARRWLVIGPVRFQPSELIKIGVILVFADKLCRNGRPLYYTGEERPAEEYTRILFIRRIVIWWRSFKDALSHSPLMVLYPIVWPIKTFLRFFCYTLFPYNFVLIISLIPLAIQPHMSAAIIIAAIAVCVLIIGGLPKKTIAVCAVIVGVAAAVVVVLANNQYKAAEERIELERQTREPSANEISAIYAEEIKPYQLMRVVFWLHPDKDPSGASYQTNMSLLAIGSGGLTGVGYLQSRMKFNYLPEKQNDYVFSIFCEETGFLGAITVMFVFALFVWRGFWIARHVRDRHTAIVVAGIVSMFALQILFNIAVITNTIPSTGISLPFFSSGLSALVTQLLGVGIVLSASRTIPEYEF